MMDPSLENSTATAPQLGQVVVPLLKGVIYRDANPEPWKALLALQMTVREYVAVLGLELELDEAEGYAFLRSRSGEVAEQPEAPRLVARRQLSFPVSLLLALLRKKLAESDAGGGETRLVLSRDQVVEMIRVFLPEGSNEARLVDQVDQHIKKIADLGFVQELRGPEKVFEVRRIIKAFVDAQWLAEFEQRLAAYRDHAAGRSEQDDA